MSRQFLSLYELDRSQLKKISAELKDHLYRNDAEGLANMLELSEGVRNTLKSHSRLVDAFLVDEENPQSMVLLASLRRISKKRAMSLVFRSEHLSLEGRLRGYEVLRDSKTAASLVDKLLSPARLPWYLRRKNATGGWLNESQGKQLATIFQTLRPMLTEELAAFGEGLGDVSSDFVAHDGL